MTNNAITDIEFKKLSLSAKIALEENGVEKCLACLTDYESIHDTSKLAKKHGIHEDFILSLVNAGDELKEIRAGDNL